MVSSHHPVTGRRRSIRRGRPEWSRDQYTGLESRASWGIGTPCSRGRSSSAMGSCSWKSAEFARGVGGGSGARIGIRLGQFIRGDAAVVRQVRARRRSLLVRAGMMSRPA